MANGFFGAMTNVQSEDYPVAACAVKEIFQLSDQTLAVRIRTDFDSPARLFKTRKVFTLEANIISSQFTKTKSLLCHVYQTGSLPARVYKA